MNSGRSWQKYDRERGQRMSDFDRPFYTPDQAAEVLQVHVNTIYKMLRAKKITYYRVGAQHRIAASELERLKVEREK